MSKTVDVLVEGDTLDEFDETFSVDLANPVGVAVADGSGVGTIVDDDAAPLVSIDDVSVTEGDAGTTTASFTVSLSGAFRQADRRGLRDRPRHGRRCPADFAGVVGNLVVLARADDQDGRRRCPG